MSGRIGAPMIAAGGFDRETRVGCVTSQALISEGSSRRQARAVDPACQAERRRGPLIATARSNASALLSVSWYSRPGSESATIPAPACT